MYDTNNCKVDLGHGKYVFKRYYEHSRKLNNKIRKMNGVIFL
jgi:hypothetical protein